MYAIFILHFRIVRCIFRSLPFHTLFSALSRSFILSFIPRYSVARDYYREQQWKRKDSSTVNADGRKIREKDRRVAMKSATIRQRSQQRRDRWKMVDKGGSAAGVARASTDQYFISASATSDRHPSLLPVPSLVSSPLSLPATLPSFTVPLSRPRVAVALSRYPFLHHIFPSCTPLAFLSCQ